MRPYFFRAPSQNAKDLSPWKVFIWIDNVGSENVFSAWRHIVLISSDSDYVPAIRLLSKMGTHTVTVGFQKLPEKQYPIELINESYLFLELSELLSEMKG